MNQVLMESTPNPNPSVAFLESKMHSLESGQYCHEWYTVLLQMKVTDAAGYIQYCI